MDFKYHIITDLGLIVENYSGEYEYKEVLDCKQLEMKDPEWRDYYHVLGDIREAKINLIEYDFESINMKFEKSYKISAKRKSAILTNIPSQVVFGTMLKGVNKVEKSFVVPEVFSTVKAALKWLEIPINETERIEGVLKELSGNK